MAVYMEFFKKNLVAIILGIVSLMAIAALFWPIDGMYDDLQTQLTNHAQLDVNIRAVILKSRQMPLLNPEQAEADPLPVFPVDSIITKAVAAVKQIAEQAQQMTTKAIDANTHLVTIPGILPKPTEEMKLDFARDFVARTKDYAEWRNNPSNPINAGRKPTDDEINAAKDKLHAEITKNVVTYVVGADGTRTPDPQSVTMADNKFAAESVNIQPGMDLELAKSKSVYLEDDALTFDKTIQTSGGADAPGPDKIWDAQLSLWVTEDVLNGVSSANQHYADPDVAGGPPVHNILHDPVKRVEKISALTPMVSKTNQPANDQTGVNSLVARDWTVSPSGRVCNGLYDVVTFEVDLVVDAAKVPQVIRQLQVGQFITMLNVQQTEVVDPATAAIDGFVYGDKPVVRLELQCEEIFMRQWTSSLVPDSRKVDFGAVPGPTNP